MSDSSPAERWNREHPLGRMLAMIEADQRATREFFDNILRDGLRLHFIERPRFLGLLAERARADGR